MPVARHHSSCPSTSSSSASCLTAAACRPKARNRRRQPQPPGRRRGWPQGSLAVGCGASTVAQAIEMHFTLPYRTHFGQSLGIIGSTADLGAWDVDTKVLMEWSDGDVWRAKVVADQGDLEYKYVVVESDGHISQWKPGSNFEVQLNGFCGIVHIEDTWDGYHAITTSEKEPAASEASPSGAAQNAAAADRAAGKEGPAPPASREDYQAILSAALEQAFSELNDTLKASEDLAKDIDPGDPQLLLNDQRLAALAERATSLSKAIAAGAPPPAYILKDIEAEEAKRSNADDAQGQK